MKSIALHRPALSVIIAAQDDEHWIGNCIDSVQTSALLARERVEIVVALRPSVDATFSIAHSLGARCVRGTGLDGEAVRNAAVRASAAPAVATVSARSVMNPASVGQLVDYAYDGDYVGGRLRTWPAHWTIGSLAFWLTDATKDTRGIDGSFWFPREAFEAIGGFDPLGDGSEDKDFAARLRLLARSRGRRYADLRGVAPAARGAEQAGLVRGSPRVGWHAPDSAFDSMY